MQDNGLAEKLNSGRQRAGGASEIGKWIPLGIVRQPFTEKHGHGWVRGHLLSWEGQKQGLEDKGIITKH